MDDILQLIMYYQDGNYTFDEVYEIAHKPVLFDYSTHTIYHRGDNISSLDPFHLLTNDCEFFVFNDEIFLCECSNTYGVTASRVKYSNDWILKYHSFPICVFDSNGYILKEYELLENNLPENISQIDEELLVYIHFKMNL